MGTEILTAIVFCGAILFLFGKKPNDNSLSRKGFAGCACALLLFGLIVRLLLGYYSQGFSSDIDTFKSWAYAANNTGLSQIYNRSDIFLDYPPGYLYVLLTLDKLRELFGITFDAPVYTLMIKLPSILADIFCGCVILQLAKNRLGEKTALLLCGAYLFCPVVIVNSAQWGQVDSFCTAILLCSALLLYKQHYVSSAVLYGISIACKPQMLIFAPMYIFFALKKKRVGQLCLGMLTAVGAILLVALPCTEGFNFSWLLQRYQSTLDYYNYYSVNAYNFWTVIGYNWRTLPEGFSLTVLTLAAPVLATVLCGAFMFFSKRKDAVFACPVILMTVMYLFGIKMHERYLFPVFLFVLLCFVFTPDKRLLSAFGAAAAVHYLNVAYVLWLFKEKGGNYDPNDTVTRLMALAQVAALLWLLYVVGRVYLSENIVEASPRGDRPWEQEKIIAKTTRVDILAVSAITVLYAIVAFWGLGEHCTAVTPWAPENGESVILQSDSEFNAVYYLPGIAPDSDGRAARVGVNIKVETSNNGTDWTDCGNLSESGSYVFCWYRHFLTTSGKYIRLTAEDGSAVINEIGLRNGVTNEYVNISTVSGGTALTDEQDALPEYLTYKASTYFDEIYHARTAYENILGLEPYENTHPPLGKYIISVGIRIFGMNPFGWRFMGTLFGVLMLPVLYHLLKQLFGSSFFCCVGTLLFAFDFMHLTQTRIATIDTYAVFFLLLMFDTMTVFLKLDLTTAKTKTMLLPLALCGVFTGLGIAAKWTAAYGAVGLAVLFFGKLVLSFRDTLRRGEDITPLKRTAVKLCLWCCLFFVAIPFAIYFAAYLPLTTLPHNIHDIWGTFVNYQVNMFNYHSQLVAEHYFASPWYEWPLDIRPIWYFSSDMADAEGHYSTITSMGNPLLWWAGVPAVISACALWLKERKTYAAVALCGFFSVYLPWVLVPRLTFIYHYFTAVPFVVVALVGVFTRFENTRFGGKEVVQIETVKLSRAKLFAAIFTAGCIALFFVFFPVISGTPTDKAYSDALRLLPTWYF